MSAVTLDFVLGWHSERRLHTSRGKSATGHVADAEIHWPSLANSPYSGQVWAIEVELTPSRSRGPPGS